MKKVRTKCIFLKLFRLKSSTIKHTRTGDVQKGQAIYE